MGFCATDIYGGWLILAGGEYGKLYVDTFHATRTVRERRRCGVECLP